MHIDDVIIVALSSCENRWRYGGVHDRYVGYRSLIRQRG